MSKRIAQLSDLQPDKTNANKGTQRGRGMVEASLREVGAGRSIVADKDGRIIAGNKTLEAWADIGGEIEIVRSDGKKLVVVQREDLDLSDDTGQARKLAYYDNRAGEVGLEWDNEQLLADLNAGIDLSSMFRQDELDELLAGLQDKPEVSDVAPQIDRAEELRQKWHVESGQLWQLGDHRLICGDCTDAATVARVMGGEKAQLCFTSPPYSDQRTYTGEGELSPQHLAEFISCSAAHVDYFAVNLGISRKDGYVDCYWDAYIDTAKRAGLKLLSWNVWYRTGGFSIGQITAMFPLEHEFVFVFGAKPAKLSQTVANEHGGASVVSTNRDADGKIGDKKKMAVRHFRELGTVLVSPPVNENGAHPAQFPMTLPIEYIKAFGCTTVYEPFSGSGTTIIACEQLGRRARAIEISPGYVAVALERWATATGKTPVLLA